MSRLRIHIQCVLILAAALITGCGKPDPNGLSVDGRLEAGEKAASAKSKLVNQPAADFTLADQVAQQVSLKTLRGNWVVLYLYPKDDMPPCTCDATAYTKCVLSFQNFYSKFKDAKFLAITDLSVPNIEAFLDAYKAKLDILSDREHKVMATYAAWAPGENGKAGSVVRSTVIIDPQGVIRYHWPDVTPAGHAVRVGQRLAELKDGTPGRSATSRPRGSQH